MILEFHLVSVEGEDIQESEILIYTFLFHK